MPRFPALALAMCAALAAAAPAQGSGSIQAATAVVRAVAPPERLPPFPQVPRQLVSPDHHATSTRLPAGLGSRPQPNTPELRVIDPLVDTGDSWKRFRDKRVVSVTSSMGMTCEPSVAFADANNAIYTGNWFAMYSSDGGLNWTDLPPQSTFPTAFGGFCCDQRVLSSGGITVWYLQYAKDASNNNLARIAVFKNPTSVGTGVPDYYFDVTPQTFGFGNGTNFDFPDVACDDEAFYFCSNANGGGTNAAAWRIKKSTLAAGSQGSGISMGYVTSTSLGGSWYRFTQEATTEMFFMCPLDTTTMRVFRWKAPSVTWFDRTVAQWNDATGNSILGNGRNWAAKGTKRVLGGYVTEEEVGFMWPSAPIGSIPTDHTRVVRFKRSDLTVIDEHVLWNSTNAVLYPAAASNTAGHVGIALAYGGPTFSPSPGTVIADDIAEFFASPSIVVWAQSTNDPDQDRWGDYFTINRHPTEPMTWVCTGHRMNGGSTNSFVQPRFLHFGREAFEPGYTGLIVDTEPAGATVQVSRLDRFSEGDGTTPFYRSYAQSTPNIKLVAPQSFVDGKGTTWIFDHWATKADPAEVTPFTAQPTAVTSFSIGDIGTAGYHCVAHYVENVPGSVTPLGKGCPDSTGRVPAHVVAGGPNGPQQGVPIGFALNNAPPTNPAILMIGVDRTQWNGLPLPLHLVVLGAANCTLHHNLVLTFPALTNAGGSFTAQATVPVNPAAIGFELTTTYAVVDPAANQLGMVFSNAVITVIGGKL